MTKGDFIKIAIGKGLIGMAGFFSIRFLTSALPLEEVGYLYLLQSWIAGFTMILISPFGTYINRSVHSWKTQYTLNDAVVSYFKYLAISSVIAAFLLLISRPQFIKSHLIIGIFSVSFYIYFNTVSLTLISTMSILGHQCLAAFLGALAAWLAIISAVFLTKICEPTSIFWQAGLGLGYFIIAWPSWSLYKKAFISKESEKKKFEGLYCSKSFFGFILPMVPLTFIAWVQSSGWRYGVSAFGSPSLVGIVAVGMLLGSVIVGLIDSALGEFYRSQFYKETSGVSSSDKVCLANAWSRYTSLVLPGLISAGVIFAACPIELGHILIDQKYQEYSWIGSIGALYQVSIIWAGAYVLLYYAEGAIIELILPSVICAALIIAGAIIGAFYWGIAGAAIGLLIGGVCTCGTMHFFARKRYSVELNWRKLLTNLVFSLCVGAMLLSFHFNFSGKNVHFIILGIAAMGTGIGIFIPQGHLKIGFNK
jgi:hypothetical protein